MKKIILFMLTSLLIVSLSNCSKDSSSSSTPTSAQTVSVSVDGVEKDFSKIVIMQKPWTDNGVPKVDLHITATNPKDNTESIHFGIGKGDLGENQLWDFAYVKNGTEYTGADPSIGPAGVYNATTINIEKRIVGTFNGGVTSHGENHVLSNGVFDINY